MEVRTKAVRGKSRENEGDISKDPCNQTWVFALLHAYTLWSLFVSLTFSPSLCSNLHSLYYKISEGKDSIVLVLSVVMVLSTEASLDLGALNINWFDFRSHGTTGNPLGKGWTKPSGTFSSPSHFTEEKSGTREIESFHRVTQLLGGRGVTGF